MAFRLGGAWDFPAFHTLEALRWRTETLRRMATTLHRKSREASDVFGVRDLWPVTQAAVAKASDL